jgi:hypothetical protein
MTFRYRRFNVPQPIWALTGRGYWPRPVCDVTILGAARAWVGAALLDSGADSTVFPEAAAITLGLDLSRAPLALASGIGGGRSLLRLAEVTLRLTDGNEFREWPARVGFTSAPLKRALLGYAGCLQFFTAAFDGDRVEVTLTVNGSYPGS